MLDASDTGLAADLGVNFAPKLANIGIGCPACVQTVTEANPTPTDNPFGPAVIHFAGAPDFSPTRIAVPGPTGFPLKNFQPGSDVPPGDKYSPFIRIVGSGVIYNAPIIAAGNGPYDVTAHTNTEDRVLGIHIGGPSQPGRFSESWVDMLFVKGFDSGEPIAYLSTEAGQPLTAVLERSTYVPALNNASFNGGDDFLGSARERLFGFINGQTGVNNPQAQGFQHLALDGDVGDNAVRQQHQLYQRSPLRGRPAQRVRRLPNPQLASPCGRLQPLMGRSTRSVDTESHQARAGQTADRREHCAQSGCRPARLADGREPGNGGALTLRLGWRRHQLCRSRLHGNRSTHGARAECSGVAVPPEVIKPALDRRLN